MGSFEFPTKREKKVAHRDRKYRGGVPSGPLRADPARGQGRMGRAGIAQNPEAVAEDQEPEGDGTQVSRKKSSADGRMRLVDLGVRERRGSPARAIAGRLRQSAGRSSGSAAGRRSPGR